MKAKEHNAACDTLKQLEETQEELMDGVQEFGPYDFDKD